MKHLFPGFVFVTALFALLAVLGCTSQEPGQGGGEQPAIRKQQSGQSAPEEVMKRGSSLGSSAVRPSPAASPEASPKASPSPPPPAPAVTPAPSPSPSLAQLPSAPVVPDRIVRLEVETEKSGKSRFIPERFEVTSGQTVEVILHNSEESRSGISHNWVLIKPGSKNAVTALGKQAGVDLDAVTYSPSILAATRTTRPGTEGITDFIAPDAPGEYPFISLVGNQYEELHGVMIVRSVN